MRPSTLLCNLKYRSYGGGALLKTLLYEYTILSKKKAKQMCGSRVGSVCESRTEAMQNMKYLELTGGRNS